MEKLIAFLEKNFSTPMAKLSEQKHLRAIRDGVVSALPFIIFGSIFLIIAFPPVPKDSMIAHWAASHISEILIPYRLTMFIMTLYITFGIGYNLSQSYKLDPLSGGLLSVAAFLFSIGVQTFNTAFFLPMANLGGHGLFVGMIVSIFAVEVLRLCKHSNFTIKLPDSVPPSVFRSFESLIPVAIVLIIMTIVTVVFGVNLHSLVDRAVAPLVKAGDTLPGVLIPVFLITFFWSFGIHGVSVVGAVARPVWEVYLGNNSSAVASGQAIPHIAPETFFQWFVWIGGSGATLGLVIAMFLVGRSSYSKTMARTTVVPSLFNINEPVIFGMPIVLNPVLIIPFIVTPLIGASLAYGATALGFVTATYVQVPWTLPAPIGAYLATGGDWRAIILVLINIAISIVVYLPFFRIYDKKLLLQEQTTDVSDHNTLAL
ncbi:PTS system cellobiose-specific transporter subunit IIC [Fictibacillus macauensis ZFHKF-1]|uniref:Permease IIC component n=1 Tax=Fictibacillus macauensis ZFHKF-1 TaxID=1196324 RepID=I8AKJ9_9BACL|nr:PTS sugar transporter subunit IIC [Fictibacillus macauensis]EIT86372.1 PTS system cellobiose-specific transporter subunit IIC [Fictibacillus macauensis ZFHKF-1]